MIVRKLSKSFGRTKALDGLTLTAEAGEKIALVGANGAGKTTLFVVCSASMRAMASCSSMARIPAAIARRC